MLNGVERFLKIRADGSWARLICRVSNYENRLISFAIFSPTHPSTLFAFSGQMYANLTYLQRKTFKQLVQNPRKKDTFRVVYAFEDLQIIFYKDESKA